MSRLPQFRPCAGLVVLALLLVTCVDNPTDPSSPRFGVVSLRPVYSPAAAIAAASGVLSINNVHMLFERGTAIVLDTVIPFPANADSLRLTFRLLLASDRDSLQGTIELRSDLTVLFFGSQAFIVTAGSTGGTPVNVPVVYLDPGLKIATVQVLPTNALVALSDSLPFRVLAFDPLGNPVSGFYASWSVKAGAGTSISADGVLHAPAGAGSGTVIVAVPSGGGTFTATAPVTFGPPSILMASDTNDLVAGNLGAVNAVDPSGAALPLASGLIPGYNLLTPRWSPDRRRIAYTHPSAALPFLPALHVLEPSSAADIAVVADTNTLDPRWNRTGQHLAFGCYGYDANFVFQSDVCVIPNVDVPATLLANLRGTMVFITDSVPQRPEGPTGFSWHPQDYDRILLVRDTIYDQDSTTTFQFLYSSSFYEANPDGSQLVRLSPPLLTIGSDTLQVRSFSWMPGGGSIVFSAVRTNRLTDVSRLYIMNPDGTGITRLTSPPKQTFGGGGDHDPMPAPDGQRILFVRDDPCPDGCVQNFFVVNTDGTGLASITANTNFGGSYRGDWSPDGKRLVLQVDGSALNQEVHLFDSASPFTDFGRIPSAHTDGTTNDRSPSWRP